MADKNFTTDEAFMREALELAERGRGRVEPNPAVGAVIVKDGRVVGQGFHERYGAEHAEVNAIRDAGGSCAGCALYVTLEPCCTQGKQPPCVAAVLSAGISRVVVGCIDQNPKHAGEGIRQLRDNGVQVDIGVCEDECLIAHAPFFKWIGTQLPFVTAKWAMSADGRTATGTGDSHWISGEASRRRVHELRGRVDGVVIGVGTAIADDPTLTCRDAEVRRVAARIIVDSEARLRPESKLARTAKEIPVIVMTTTAAPEKNVKALSRAGCRIIQCGTGGSVDLKQMVRKLGEDGFCNLLVEGGATLLGGMFDDRLVDRAMVFVAPIILGGETSPGGISGMGAPVVSEGMRLLKPRIERIEDDVLLTGEVVYPRMRRGR
ncbi:MAG TPA: bifunctional diaminohydroxyphosphoribosylaminopyrimidine deaminase/5-amino-6-(5-phosphoribosylamino)uracil reductase RibD [Candidatus Brocadiia bacterium]|nr:bifunctional diaminohydroxyphosphoribosylaminopyrimidine deaminase/5-amino-6-(5-phosphoribosylamino)uracil reductase RibD [Candidatus Brocadiia bacterium]